MLFRSQITALTNKINQLQAALLALKSLEAPATSTVTTLPYAPSTVSAATYDPLSGLKVTPEDARAYATGELRKTSTTSMTGYGPYRESERTSIVVNAQTNASPQQIANDVGWAIRTSSDVQYRTSAGYTDYRAGER